MLPGLWSRSILLVAVQALASQDVRPGRQPADSSRVVKNARDEQETFERMRRANLPRGSGAPASGCEGHIGRICYWSDESDDASHAPPEPARIVEGRKRLIDRLARAHRDVPGDDWIAGQWVRYLAEAGRADDAVAAAHDCQGDHSWCRALEGYALHVKGNFAGADSAFRDALDSMSGKERCRWDDVRLLVDDALSKRLERLGCEGRDSLAARIWWLATPLYMIGTNDLRTEHLARMTRARMEERAKSTMGLSWANDLREVLIRYGWDTWFTREDPTYAAFAEPRVTGHPLWPSFDFLPPASIVDSMTTARADAWTLRGRGLPTRYSAAYIKSLRPLSHQLAVFRRADSALFVAAFDLRQDTAFANEPLAAALYVTNGPGQLWGHADTLDARSGVLETRAPWTPALASIEVLSSKHHSAARARYGVKLPESPGRVSVSDLLLFAGGDTPPEHLGDAAARALTTSRMSRRQSLGLFWETYGLRAQGEPLAVSLTIEEIGAPLLRRAARVLHLTGKGSPLRVQWQEVPDRESGIASRAVSVDLGRLRPGRYLVRLTLTPRDAPPATATRDIDVAR